MAATGYKWKLKPKHLQVINKSAKQNIYKHKWKLRTKQLHVTNESSEQNSYMLQSKAQNTAKIYKRKLKTKHLTAKIALGSNHRPGGHSRHATVGCNCILPRGDL